MGTSHISVESVQAYLLGTLGEKESASLEVKYFTDRAFFLRVQSIEAELIQRYLDGRLTRAVRDQFEHRYLTVPELRRRLDEARNRQASVPEQTTRDFKAWTALALAGTAAILVIAGVWLSRQLRVDFLPTEPVAQPIVARLTLAPGVLMGAARGGRLALPEGRGAALLTLELPVSGDPVTCSVRISEVAGDGRLEERWSSPQALQSTQAEQRQQLSLVLDVRLLPPGDYIVDVTGLDRSVRATYLFRVVSATR